MTRPTKIVVNCSTGAQEEVELTDAEIAENQLLSEAHAVWQAEETAKQEALMVAKQSAKDKLTALGLTEEEALALVGVTQQPPL